LKVRLLVAAEWIKTKGAVLEYCPTEDMIADVLTKPLQGELFRNLSAKLNRGELWTRRGALVEPVEQSEPNQLNSGSVSPPFSRLGDSKNEAQLKEHGVSLQDPEHYGTFESVEGFEDKG
jgi:hypothetical protein